MAVTQRDVAKKAGVTKIVVSHVLHNRASTVRVSEATAERVRKAAEELGYRCNVWARNFRTQQTNTIGVLHGVGFDRPRFDGGSRYFAQLMDGVVDGAFQHGYSVTLCPKLLGDDPYDAMSDGRFDGLVWYSTSPSELRGKILQGANVPLVVLHTKLADLSGAHSTVSCDNDQGIRLAVEHLISLGHRRIAFLCESAAQVPEFKEREDAYRRSMTHQGLDVDVVDTHFDGALLDRFLASKPPHTAVICAYDQLAAEVMSRAADHGIRIPEDLSVVGFDSTAYCNELRPRLTSAKQPLFEMGVRAIEALVREMKGESDSPVETVVPCGFDVRESTTSR
jgi:LacI family transcriptional regulator